MFRLTAEYESPELILKVRTAGAREQDYIEVGRHSQDLLPAEHHVRC